MKVILFGATGMVGQGVLRECLLDDGIESVLELRRNSLLQKVESFRYDAKSRQGNGVSDETSIQLVRVNSCISWIALYQTRKRSTKLHEQTRKEFSRPAQEVSCLSI